MEILNPTAPIIGESTISVLAYADDVALLTTKPEILQEVLRTLEHWSNVSRMKINLGRNKTEVMHFNISSPEPIALFGDIIPVTDVYTYLGYEIGPSINTHVTHRRKKLKNWLEEVKNRLSGNNIDYDQRATIIKTYMRPKLAYCLEFCTPTRTMLTTLEQNERGFFYQACRKSARIHKFTLHSPFNTGWNIPKIAHHQVLKLCRYVLSLNRMKYDSRQVKVTKALLEDPLSWLNICFKYWNNQDPEFQNWLPVPTNSTSDTIPSFEIYIPITMNNDPSLSPIHPPPSHIYSEPSDLDDDWISIREKITIKEQLAHQANTESLSFDIINHYCDNTLSQYYRRSPRVSASLANFTANFRNMRLASREVIERIFKKKHLATPKCSLCENIIDYPFHFLICPTMWNSGCQKVIFLLRKWGTLLSNTSVPLPFFPVDVSCYGLHIPDYFTEARFLLVIACASGAYAMVDSYRALGLQKKFKQILPDILNFTRSMWLEFQEKRHSSPNNIDDFIEEEYDSNHHVFRSSDLISEFVNVRNSGEVSDHSLEAAE